MQTRHRGRKLRSALRYAGSVGLEIDNTTAGEQRTRAEAVRAGVRRASAGRVLVAFAVFAPVLIILAGFLLSRGSIYKHRIVGPRWPWIVADVALLLIGMRLMRGEDL